MKNTVVVYCLSLLFVYPFLLQAQLKMPAGWQSSYVKITSEDRLVYNREAKTTECSGRNTINGRIITAYSPADKKIPGEVSIDRKTDRIMGNDIAEAKETMPKVNNMNLNNFRGVATLNEAWTWWNYPQVITTNTYNKSLIYGWTNSLGYSGVSQLNLTNKKYVSNTLKQKEIDDHNAPGVLRMNDGRLLVAYTDGHGSGNNIHIRTSKSNREYISDFDHVKSIDCGASTTYVQMFYINNAYYIFSRIGVKNWGYIKSDDGENWSGPHIFLTANTQYYIKLAKITDRPNMLRMCMYSNPTTADAKIRMGFLDFENDKILQSDGTELATFSTGSADKELFNVLIPYPTNGDNSQRMFDVAETDYSDIVIAYCTFNTKNANASKYYIYENGLSTKILDNGESFWHPKYQGGISFIEADKIVLSRNWEGYDYIELWDKADVWNKTKELFSEATTNNNRNVRPIVDINKRYIIWQRGYYNPSTYTDFMFNTMIYDLGNDKLVE